MNIFTSQFHSIPSRCLPLKSSHRLSFKEVPESVWCSPYVHGCGVLTGITAYSLVKQKPLRDEEPPQQDYIDSVLVCLYCPYTKRLDHGDLTTAWINALISSSLHGLLGSGTFLEEGEHWSSDLKGYTFLFLELPLHRDALPYHTWAQKQ